MGENQVAGVAADSPYRGGCPPEDSEPEVDEHGEPYPDFDPVAWRRENLPSAYQLARQRQEAELREHPPASDMSGWRYPPENEDLEPEFDEHGNPYPEFDPASTPAVSQVCRDGRWRLQPS